jgi:hypothetical protein
VVDSHNKVVLGKSDGVNGAAPLTIDPVKWSSQTYKSLGNVPPALVNFGCVVIGDKELLIYGGRTSDTARISVLRDSPASCEGELGTVRGC